MATKRATPPSKSHRKGTKAPPAPTVKTLNPGDVDETGYIVGDGFWRHRLLTQQQLAEIIDLTERQVRNLEEKGLPNEGHRGTKVYPIPDCLAWLRAYRKRLDRRDGRDGREGVTYLDPRVSRAEHALESAEATAALEAQERRMYGRLLTESESEELCVRGQYLQGAHCLTALLGGAPLPARPLGPNCIYDEE